MARSGRPSLASRVTTPVTSLMTNERLSPPPTLTQAELSIWNQVVADQPATAFTKVHEEALYAYCRHSVYAHILSEKITNFDMSLLVDMDGIKMYDRLLVMHDRETKAIQLHARSLRITKQSIDQQTVARALLNDKKGRKPWDAETVDNED